jgi:hypothetical protein
MNLADILKDSDYKLSQFNAEEIVKCLVRTKAKSKQLLEISKTGVESAIKENEERAIRASHRLCQRLDESAA